MTVTADEMRIIRPAAVLDEQAAAGVLLELDRLDVAAGGMWSASSSLWQRYDRPWDGAGSTRGSAQLMGSIAVMYDAPNRHQITIYKVTVTDLGRAAGWTVESVCDDALAVVGLSLATCPRAELTVARCRRWKHLGCNPVRGLGQQLVDVHRDISGRGAELWSQGCHRLARVGVHRFAGVAEDLGDLRLGPVLVVAEHDHRPLPRR